MLTERTSKIVGLVRQNQGKNLPQAGRMFNSPVEESNQPSSHKLASNMDLILPLVLNANVLGLDGFQASLLLTLANLIVASETSLLPPSLKELSDKMGCGRSTLEKHINQLKQLGFIEIDKTLDDRGYSRNFYHFKGLQDKLQALGVEV